MSVDKQIIMKSFDILFIFGRFFFSIVVIEFAVFYKIMNKILYMFCVMKR